MCYRRFYVCFVIDAPRKFLQMDKSMKNLLSGVIITVGAINVALFGVWMSLVKIEAASEDMSTYIHNSITVNFTILEIILGIVAFGSAVAAFFGYQAIKDGAERKATETAEEYLRTNGPEMIKKQVQQYAVFSQPSHELSEASPALQSAVEEGEDRI